MMISGTTVKHWSRTQATRALRQAEAECYQVITGTGDALGLQSMMSDLGLSAHGSCLDGLQCSQGDCVKRRLWGDQTCGSEMLVAA